MAGGNKVLLFWISPIWNELTTLNERFAIQSGCSAEQLVYNKA